jgi:hypothetical protein
MNDHLLQSEFDPGISQKNGKALTTTVQIGLYQCGVAVLCEPNEDAVQALPNAERDGPTKAVSAGQGNEASIERKC